MAGFCKKWIDRRGERKVDADNCKWEYQSQSWIYFKHHKMIIIRCKLRDSSIWDLSRESKDLTPHFSLKYRWSGGLSNVIWKISSTLWFWEVQFSSPFGTWVLFNVASKLLSQRRTSQIIRNWQYKMNSLITFKYFLPAHYGFSYFWALSTASPLNLSFPS